MKTTIKMVIELNPEEFSLNWEDSDEVKWFYEDILQEELGLFSQEIGDYIGKVIVKEIREECHES